MTIKVASCLPCGAPTATPPLVSIMYFISGWKDGNCLNYNNVDQYLGGYEDEELQGTFNKESCGEWCMKVADPTLVPPVLPTGCEFKDAGNVCIAHTFGVTGKLTGEDTDIYCFSIEPEGLLLLFFKLKKSFISLQK